MKYKVTDPSGVLIDGKRIEQGEGLPASSTSSQVKAFLRFNQIKAVDAEAQAPQEEEPSKAPSTVDELKVALLDLKIEIPDGAKKADLEKLYAEAQAPQE